MGAFDQLRPHVGTRRKIRLQRSRPSCPTLNGYLVGLSEDWGALHAFDDFEPDGWTLFRVADVVSVRSGPYERHWDRMLASEGLLAGLDIDIQVDLTDARSIITSLDRRFGRMIVECEDPDENAQDFYIGCVVRMDEHALWFDCFDGLGAWASDPQEIALDEITMFQAETPYLQRFWRYVGKRPSR